MIKYRINIVQALADKGVNTYTCKQTGKPFAQGTFQQIKKNKAITTDTINKLCAVLDLQPGDLLEYIPDIDQTEVRLEK